MKTLRVGDFVVVGAVLTLALGIFLWMLLSRSQSSTQLVCEISQQNEVIARIPLSEDTHETLTVGGRYENTIEIAGTQARFLHASCNNQVCVRTGWVSHPYETAACLPNHVLVKIVSDGAGAESEELDGITAEGLPWK